MSHSRRSSARKRSAREGRRFLRVATLTSAALLAGGAALALSEVAAEGAGAASTIRLRIPGSPTYAEEREIAVREALLIDTLSVFIGKSGAVRLRGGMTAAIVVLSSQELGCGRVQDAEPAVYVLGAKRAAEFAQRLEATRPHVADPPRRFEPRGDEDFEITVTARFPFDPKGMDGDPGAPRPFFFELLEGRVEEWWALAGYDEVKAFYLGLLDRDVGKSGAELVLDEGRAGEADAVTLHLGEASLRPGSLIVPGFSVTLLHEKAAPTGDLAKAARKTGVDVGGVSLLQLENQRWRQAAGRGRTMASAPPWFEIQRRDGELRVKLDVEEPSLSVHADVPLRRCPAVEHIHIEPKK
jgi:hypothetical protein